jgi:hypothetical protein
LVTGPETLSEAASALAEGKAAAMMVWSEERLSRAALAAKGLTALAEQRFQQGSQRDWMSLVRRAAPLDPKSTLVLEGGTAASGPAGQDVVLVWRGLATEDVQTAIAEVDEQPHYNTAR